MALLTTDKLDFKVDPLTGDLDLSGGRLNLSSGIDGVAQGIMIRVKMVRGEWFLNKLFGVPYYERTGVVTKDEALLGMKPFNRGRAIAAFRDVIITAPGVDKLLLIDVSFDNKTRGMRLKWRVRTAFGDTPTNEVVIA